MRDALAFAAERAPLTVRLTELVAELGIDLAAGFLRSPAAGTGDQPAGFEALVGALDLTPVEADLLALAGLAEEHEGYAAVFRRLAPTGEPYPTVGLAAQLLCEDPSERPVLRRVLELGAAVAAGALAVPGPLPFFERPLALGDALWPALHGLDVWPAGVRSLALDTATAGLESWLDSPPARRAAAALRRGTHATILVAADSEDVALARAVALVLHAGSAPAALELESPALMRLAGTHALARGQVPLLRIAHVEGPDAQASPDPGDHPGPVVLCGRPGAVAVRGTRPVLSVPVAPLDAPARRRMWVAALPELADEAHRLAARHAVEPAAAAAAAADVRALELIDGRPAGTGDVARSLRVRAGLSLSAGVRLLRPTARWEALVLRPDRLAQLREALARLEHQSRVLDEWGFLDGRSGARGVRMLFSGLPGTGKTLAAEVLAHALGVDLLIVDISRVVSKWIGETEKNLAEVFDAAERAQAVLFFDEADGLFGRRTEISDAHDRYANLETAYLLARLERFEGLAVLATNLRQNIDPAFTRRLEFALEFEEPAAPEREALWRCHLPERAPLADDVDLAQLATLYAVVGGTVRNAATAAAFLAAAEDGQIARRHLVRALRREYEKAGRAFPGEPNDPTLPGRTHG